MPNRTRNKRCHRTSEPRFLAAWRHPQVNVIPQPFIGILIPCLQVFLIVLGCFQSQRGDVCDAIPPERAVGIVPVEA